MPRRTLAEISCGEAVFTALMEARPAGLKTSQLMLATGLSQYHVRRGLMFLRTELATARTAPLTFSMRDGWLLTPTGEVCFEYIFTKVETLLRSVNLLMTGTLAPYAALFPDQAVIETAAGQLLAVENSLTTLKFLGDR